MVVQVNASCATGSRRPRTSRRTWPKSSHSPAPRCGPTSRTRDPKEQATCRAAGHLSGRIAGGRPLVIVSEGYGHLPTITSFPER